MGLNSTHDVSQDFIRGINTSKDNKTFRCSCYTRNFSYMQVVQNIDLSIVQCVIVIHDSSVIEVGDLLKLPLYDDVLKVENTVSVKIDQSLFRKRKDVNNFRGALQVALS